MKIKFNSDKFKGVIVSVLTFALTMAGVGFAKSATEWIEVEYSDINVYVDGERIEIRDANGNPVEPFTYNGTTYLPARAVGESLGKNVGWDEKNKNVHIGYKPYEEPKHDIVTGFRNLTASDTEELALLNEVVETYGKASWGKIDFLYDLGENEKLANKSYYMESINELKKQGVVSATILETNQSNGNLILVIYLYGEETPKSQTLHAVLVSDNGYGCSVEDRISLDSKWIDAFSGFYRNTNIGLTTKDNKVYLYFEDRQTGTQGIGVDYKIYDVTAGKFDRKLYLSDKGYTGTESTVYKIENDSFDLSLCNSLNITDDNISYKEALDAEFDLFGLFTMLPVENLYDYKPNLYVDGTHKIMRIFSGDEENPYSNNGRIELIDYTGLDKILK